ncbi:DNA adenine methylase [Telluribacter sp.]|jgi:adenine-specific DNA-methyltransferase|uniref:DNA adenine methylase n=1 Tax=Telluribacter sp. TaxID=1978767 RepID=UPI002E0FF417|nr:DNA adenine methylase [Telluribacter sp.]
MKNELIDKPEIEPKIPHLLKYMGSKREILDFVLGAMEALNVESTWFCDLFAGTGVVGASLKGKYNIHTNDIQQYSSVLSRTYLCDLQSSVPYIRLKEIKKQAEKLIAEVKTEYPKLKFDYQNIRDYKQVTELEKAQQKLIDKDFDIGFHLFTKYYSGTYWSFEQCLWIDSLRCVAEMYQGRPEYFAIMSSLISAMSYVTQSTGHYAQYRDVTTDNINDILIYRNRSLWTYFERKFNELIISLNGSPIREYKVTTMDYLDCLRVIEEGSIVYADPPYQSVHYSRFYHALETLVKYDYPVVEHKGRYRNDRHQSPFCKKTTVNKAFNALFHAIKKKKAHLALSYSDTGMISLEHIQRLGQNSFGSQYTVQVLEKDHIHSTMGRSDEKNQDVKEFILLFKYNGGETKSL